MAWRLTRRRKGGQAMRFDKARVLDVFLEVGDDGIEALDMANLEDKAEVFGLAH